MPNGDEKAEADRQFTKVERPIYMAAREALMLIPATTNAALAQKMEYADPTSEDHWDSVLADAKALAEQGK